MRAIELIQAIIDNKEINGGGYDVWTCPKHIADTYKVRINETDAFLIQTFLNASISENEDEAFKTIKSLVNYFFYNQDFS